MQPEEWIGTVKRVDSLLEDYTENSDPCGHKCCSHLSSRYTWEDMPDWQKVENNPHVAEIMLNRDQHYEVDMKFERVLRNSAKRRKYFRRVDMHKTTIHWGQRKLLLSEIEFFTLIGEKGLRDAVVVYAGAAPGTHISYLASLFPYVSFILVDPAPFSIVPTGKIEILQELFTDELARDLRQAFDKIYFISDIRTADPDRHNEFQIETKVKHDMQAQMKWHRLLRSRRSMLKFRLPWDFSRSVYLDGDIYLPVWGPQTTTECRLITGPDPDAVRVYDHKKYEEQMFYFNTVTRHSLYQHDVVCEGMDHCYDCKAEVDILYNYIKDFVPISSEANIFTKIAQMSEQISASISRNRTLADPNPDKEERKRVIRRRQEISGRPAHEVFGKRLGDARRRRRSRSPPRECILGETKQMYKNSALHCPTCNPNGTD
jgi:cap2 methyltransferase